MIQNNIALITCVCVCLFEQHVLCVLRFRRRRHRRRA